MSEFDKDLDINLQYFQKIEHHCGNALGPLYALEDVYKKEIKFTQKETENFKQGFKNLRDGNVQPLLDEILTKEDKLDNFLITHVKKLKELININVDSEEIEKIEKIKKFYNHLKHLKCYFEGLEDCRVIENTKKYEKF